MMGSVLLMGREDTKILSGTVECGCWSLNVRKTAGIFV